MRATWFEIPVENMERAKQFYETIFGIHLADPMAFGNSSMCFFPSDANETGATGTLIQQESYTPSYQGALIYLSVREINEITPKIVSAGGKIINEKMSIGEHGFVAHFEDSEGNRVALHQLN